MNSLERNPREKGEGISSLEQRRIKSEGCREVNAQLNSSIRSILFNRGLYLLENNNA